MRYSPSKVEYAITGHGKKLIPIFKLIEEWGDDIGSKLGESYECVTQTKI